MSVQSCTSHGEPTSISDTAGTDLDVESPAANFTDETKMTSRLTMDGTRSATRLVAAGVCGDSETSGKRKKTVEAMKILMSVHRMPHVFS
jgi:hypothetical protein